MKLPKTLEDGWKEFEATALKATVDAGDLEAQPLMRRYLRCAFYRGAGAAYGTGTTWQLLDELVAWRIEPDPLALGTEGLQ